MQIVHDWSDLQRFHQQPWTESMRMPHHSLTLTLHFGCATIQRLVIYAMTSLYFQESLFLRCILLVQQQELQNQRWWAPLSFDLPMTKVSSILSRWPTWIICPSLQSTYSQQEFSANNLRMNMVLIDKGQEFHQSSIITLYFGIMGNLPRLSWHILLVFRNVL